MPIYGQDSKVKMTPIASVHDKHRPAYGKPMRGAAQDFSNRPSGRDKGIMARTGKPPKKFTGKAPKKYTPKAK